MRAMTKNSLYLLICVFLCGCGGSSQIKTKGHITQGGQPFQTEESEGMRIFFSPVEATSESSYDSFAAEYHREDGSFTVLGKDGKGLPPGTYRVGIQLMKKKEDLFKNRLMGKKSPFTCEIVDGSSEVTIDLDKAKEVVAAVKR